MRKLYERKKKVATVAKGSCIANAVAAVYADRDEQNDNQFFIKLLFHQSFAFLGRCCIPCFVRFYTKFPSI